MTDGSLATAKKQVYSRENCNYLTPYQRKIVEILTASSENMSLRLSRIAFLRSGLPGKTV